MDQNTDAGESMVGSLIAYSVVLTVVDVVIVALRYYVRAVVLRKFGSDDVLLGATLWATVAGVIGITYATRLGLGIHIDRLSMDERSTLLKLIFASALGYHATIMLVKATFLFQFRRVFPLPGFQRLCDIFLAFLAVWAVAGLVGGITICLPLNKNWDPLQPAWICDGRLWFWIVHGIMHVVTDFVIFIMPLPLLRTLPLPTLHKVVLIGVFCLGFFTCVISAVRLTTLPASLRDEDVSWTSATTVFWSLGEVTCSIICLCIPVLRPLLGDCCAPRKRGTEYFVERGTRGFEFYAISSLPSTEDSRGRERTETGPAPTGPAPPTPALPPLAGPIGPVPPTPALPPLAAPIENQN